MTPITDTVVRILPEDMRFYKLYGDVVSHGDGTYYFYPKILRHLGGNFYELLTLKQAPELVAKSFEESLSKK